VPEDDEKGTRRGTTTATPAEPDDEAEKDSRKGTNADAERVLTSLVPIPD
jgi:hypothetical protein